MHPVSPLGKRLSSPPPGVTEASQGNPMTNTNDQNPAAEMKRYAAVTKRAYRAYMYLGLSGDLLISGLIGHHYGIVTGAVIFIAIFCLSLSHVAGVEDCMRDIILEN